MFWSLAMVAVSIAALALGYLIHPIAGVMFWLIATLILLALRPI